MSESDKTPFEETWERQEFFKREMNARLANLDADAWLSICQVLVFPFVQSHVSWRQRYMPDIRRESLDNTFLQDFHNALLTLEHDLPNTVARIEMEPLATIRTVLEHLEGNIQWLMSRPTGTP